MVDRIVGFACAVLGLLSLSIPTGRPQVVIVKERWAPLTQWMCDKTEAQERARTCAQRERSAEIVERTNDKKPQRM